ncbi:MAG TPA: hypothetical protein PKA51_11040, partial [Kiritimatiellia bacterium]|nr:hypothetical protein [Kiritimatiellia bacterium]
MTGSHLRRTFIALVALTLALLVPLPFRAGSRVAIAWWDFTHVPVMAAIAIGVICLMRHHRPGHTWTLPVALVLALLVPVFECAQPLFGRDAAWADVAYGWIGVLVGAWFAAPSTRMRIAGIALGAAATVIPVIITLDMADQRARFPVLSRFDAPLEAWRWRITGGHIRRDDGWKVVITEQPEFTALFLRDFPRDWSAMDRLSLRLDALGPGPVAVWIRIDDGRHAPKYHERFQRRYLLPPGPHTISISREELLDEVRGVPLNLKRIREFGIFFEQRDAG